MQVLYYEVRERRKQGAKAVLRVFEHGKYNEKATELIRILLRFLYHYYLFTARVKNQLRSSSHASLLQVVYCGGVGVANVPRY